MKWVEIVDRIDEECNECKDFFYHVCRLKRNVNE
jgi:hypothetical protein